MGEDIDLAYADDLKLLGARIKKARVDRGLSVRDLVIHHDYHDAQWRRYESGASLTVPSLLRIAKVLGVTPSVLLKGIGSTKGQASLRPKSEDLGVQLKG